MAADQADIRVEIACNCRGLEVDFDRLRKLVEQICRRFAVNKAAINVAIVGDETIKKVNTEFLDRPQPTDVISFDLSDDHTAEQSYDLMVNAEEAARQSAKRGHSTEAELALYITHGLLHNLGFDHAGQSQSRKMHNMEDEILQQAGFDIIYGT
jgi:probable rRNA maturation factor